MAHFFPWVFVLMLLLVFFCRLDFVGGHNIRFFFVVYVALDNFVNKFALCALYYFYFTLTA